MERTVAPQTQETGLGRKIAFIFFLAVAAIAALLGVACYGSGDPTFGPMYGSFCFCGAAGSAMLAFGYKLKLAALIWLGYLLAGYGLFMIWRAGF